MIHITATEGHNALGALAKAAIPPGIDRPPLPTMFLRRLEISSPIPATPVSPQASDSKRQFGLNFAFEFSSTTAALSVSSTDANDALDDCRGELMPPYSDANAIASVSTDPLPFSGSMSAVETDAEDEVDDTEVAELA